MIAVVWISRIGNWVNPIGDLDSRKLVVSSEKHRPFPMKLFDCINRIHE